MPRPVRRTATFLATLVGLLGALGAFTLPASAAERTVPFGFFGSTLDGPLLDDPGAPLDREARTMVKSGVESLRAGFYWSDVQPYATLVDVPAPSRVRFTDVGGVPTDWSGTDRVVAIAATRGFRLLPNVLRAPRWAAAHPGSFNSPPAGTAPYAAFMGALVRRYGPDGDFWRLHPDLPRRPVRDWQIWNEPNQPIYFWSDQPFARDYVSLLRASRAAVLKVDPRARIVLAGLVGLSYKDLGRIYAAGGHGLFDVAAIHPFTNRVNNVMRLVRWFRSTLDRNGGRKVPIIVSELAWPTAKGRVPRPYGYEVTQSEQASRLAQVYPRLIAERRRLRIESTFWYTWASVDQGNDSFFYSGLRGWRDGRIVAKPAYVKFRAVARRSEGCAKLDVATRCR